MKNAETMDLPPLSPLSSMYDPRSPCASSKAGSSSSPSDDDLILRRRSSSAATPPSTPSSSNALRASLDSAATPGGSGGGHAVTAGTDNSSDGNINNDNDNNATAAGCASASANGSGGGGGGGNSNPAAMMHRVSSVMSLDIPTGKAETLPHNGPPPRPATPCSARLPRSRVFIKHPSLRGGSLIDPVAVGPAPADGEPRLIVRHVTRPASPSPLSRQHHHHHSGAAAGVAVTPSSAPPPSLAYSPSSRHQHFLNLHHQHQQQQQELTSHAHSMATATAAANAAGTAAAASVAAVAAGSQPPFAFAPRRWGPTSLQTNDFDSIHPHTTDANNISNNNNDDLTNNPNIDPHHHHHEKHHDEHENDFYFSDDEPPARQPASLDVPLAPQSLPASATPIPLPPALQSNGIVTASLAAHSHDDDDVFDPDAALRGGNGTNGVIDSALSNKVRRAVSALRSISFQTSAPEDVDTAWGQANTASARKLSVPRRTDARPPSPARRRSRPPLAASRWRRPRGRISSKHGVQSYDCYSEADVRSRRVSEDIPPPPRSLVSPGPVVSNAAAANVVTAMASTGSPNGLVSTLNAGGMGPSRMPLGAGIMREGDLFDDGVGVDENEMISADVCVMPQPSLREGSIFHSARQASGRPSFQYQYQSQQHQQQYPHQVHGAINLADRGFTETTPVVSADAAAGVVARRETVRDGPQRRSAPVRHTSHRSLWGGRRDGGSNRAAQLLLSNGGQSLFAAATTAAAAATSATTGSAGASSQAMVAVGENGLGGGGVTQPVDKYVEFIHASAQRETVKAKPKNLPGRVINRAQAVLRRKWK